MRNEHERDREYDPGIYQTGRTQPPKSHSGLIAVLLVVVILLCSLVSIMSFLNIRLFQRMRQLPNDKTLPLSASVETTTAPEPKDATGPTVGGESVTISLHPSPQGVENVPQTGGLSLQEIYAGCIRSVVSISCSGSGGTATGSGIVLSANGYLLTNCHVVAAAETIQVRFHDGNTLPASLVGADAMSDLAVLRVNASDLQPAQLGDSDALRVGDVVVAIGDPLGIQLHGTMTDGIVSAINRDLSVGGRAMTLIQTNAALNSGNSGGPLLNCYGQVIGINTMKIGDTFGAESVEGLGFAIPSTTVQEIANQLIRQGYVSGRPDLGIKTQPLSGFYQMYYQLPSGLYVTEVTDGGSAGRAGVRVGDVLLALDGTRITSQETLNNVLYAHQAGDKLEIVIYRGGRQYTADIILGEAK